VTGGDRHRSKQTLNVLRALHIHPDRETPKIMPLRKRNSFDEQSETMKEHFQSLVENVHVAIFSLDSRGRFTYLSPVFEQITSYRSEELVGRALAPLVHPDDLEGFLYGLKSGLAGTLESFEFRLMDKNGNIHDVQVSCRQWFIEGRVAGLIGVLTDITRQKWFEKRSKFLTFRDKLTGLYNRAYFEEEMNRFDTRRQLPLSIILGDVNGLKLVNDAFGHLEGDRLLSKVAGILQDACRQEDIVARLSGDEFAIFLPRTHSLVALNIIRRIKTACRDASQDPIALSIALGAATKRIVSQNLKALLKEAEERMYQDKLSESKSVRGSILSSLQQKLFEKKYEAEGHIDRLNRATGQIGRELGLSGKVLDELTLLSTVHDIGKVALPEVVQFKKGALTQDEWRTIWKHPEIGYRIASGLLELAPVAEAILAHHERWDGAGYPRGLREEEIPLTSRILSIADAYDVMTHDQVYRNAMNLEMALGELKKGAGSQFDPWVTELFLELAFEREQMRTQGEAAHDIHSRNRRPRP